MTRHRADPRPGHLEGRTAADGGQLRAGRRAAAGRPGPGRGGLPPLPVPAECLVAGPRRAGAGPGPLPARPGVGRRCSAPRTGLAGRLDGAGLGRGHPGPSCWPGGWPWTWAVATTPTVICAPPQRSRRRGPALSRASGWLSEALRAQAAGDTTPAARRLPPRAGPSWTSTGSPWARRSCGRRPPRTAPNWPRIAQRHARAGAPAAAAAGLGGALAGHRAGRPGRAAAGRRGSQRRAGRAPPGDQRGCRSRGDQGVPPGRAAPRTAAAGERRCGPARCAPGAAAPPVARSASPG